MSKIAPATDEQLESWEHSLIYNDDLRFAIRTLIGRVRLEQEARKSAEELSRSLQAEIARLSGKLGR